MRLAFTRDCELPWDEQLVLSISYGIAALTIEPE